MKEMVAAPSDLRSVDDMCLTQGPELASPVVQSRGPGGPGGLPPGLTPAEHQTTVMKK